MSRPYRHLNFDVGLSNLADTFFIVGIKKLRVFSFYLNVNVRYQKQLFLHLCILTEEIKENLIINYKILFASLFDIITKPPSLSILFFHPTLTPLLPHSPSTTLFTPLSLTLLFSLNSPSHLSFNQIFSHTTLLTPFSLTPLFPSHSPSHHSFHAILSHTTLFTPFSLTPLFSPHSSSHHSFHSILPHTTLFTPFSLTQLFSPHSPTSFSYSSKLIFSPQSLSPILSLHYFAITF